MYLTSKYVTKVTSSRVQTRSMYLLGNSQLRLARDMFVVMVAGATLAAMNLLVGRYLWSLYDATGITSSDWPTAIAAFIYVILLMCVCGLLVWLLVLYFSHRISGAEYKISKVIVSYLDGERDIRVKLRRNDHLDELATHVNRLIEFAEGKTTRHLQGDERDGGQHGTPPNQSDGATLDLRRRLR